MSKFFVSGVANIETVVPVEEFPIPYQPVDFRFFGIISRVSAVGFNLTKSFTALGSSVNFASIIGQDFFGALIKQELTSLKISTDYVVTQMRETPQSVVLYDRNAKRRVSTDLKDIQSQIYPPDLTAKALKECSLAVLTNINFSRPIIKKTQELNIPIACDLQTLSQLDDGYNREFMQAAQILAMSHEALPCSPQEFAIQLFEKYGTEIVIIGMGEEGALLAVKKDNYCKVIPSVTVGPVVSTGGAGDALFSAFLHFYNKTSDPYFAIKRAIVYASYKVGSASSSEGYLSESELEILVQEHSLKLKEPEI